MEIYGRTGKPAVGGAFAGGGVPSAGGTGGGQAYGNSHFQKVIYEIIRVKN